jgi:hypothetical protein
MQKNALINQVVFRDLKDHANRFGSPFISRVRAGANDLAFHWMDSGTGLGLAPLLSVLFDPESDLKPLLSYADKNPENPLPQIPPARIRNITLVGYEDMVASITLHPNFEENVNEALLQQVDRSSTETNSLKAVLRLARRAAAHPDLHLRSFHGMSIFDRPASSFEKYSLITDYLGPFTYTEKKLELLHLYWRLLEPGGIAFIHSTGNRALMHFTNESPRAQPWQFNEWISKLKLEDIEANTAKELIIIRKSRNIRQHPQLEKLMQETSWIEAETQLTIPPLFVYRTRIPAPAR